MSLKSIKGNLLTYLLTNKATTFRQLNRTVPFLAQPVGIPCENNVGKNSAKFCGTVRQFEFSCTCLAHGHGVQQNVGLTFFIQRLQTFCHVFTFLTFLFLFERFFTSMISTITSMHS